MYFPPVVFSLLFLLNLIVEIGPRGDKTNQTENQAGCQASLSASLSQCLEQGNQRGRGCSGFCPVMTQLMLAWQAVGEPHDCMALTQPPMELEAKSEEGSNDLTSKWGAAAFPSLK